MLRLKMLMSAMVLALAVVALPVWAEDAAPAAPAPAADAASDASLIAQEKAAPNNQDVWWGNRSVGFGNYLKFDKPNPPACCCDHRKVCVNGCSQPCGNCALCKLITFDKIFFDLDKSVLRPAGREECDKVVAYMNENSKVDVLVEGHCCDLASDAYNIGLGKRRAESVKRYLIEHGVAESRITTQTFGERQPWQPIEHRELNRRAIVIVVPDQK